ncbi:MAG: Hpt domain-containing protein [Clostridia bacterium]|nr:Hpt domain-containing protein [Clostridia bacterium]
MTIEALKAYGADVKGGLARCMGMESFYLRLVGMELADPNFDKLDKALAAQNAREAFEAAHALKGATGNLGLTPLFAPLSEITEKLRGAQAPIDLGGLEEAYREALKRLKALA